jgi:hypothetical protein
MMRQILLLILLGVYFAPIQLAADEAIAYFNISGTVPAIFSVTSRGVPGDLDLSPNVTVNNRRIGLLHFKYNIDVATLLISSNTLSGGPETSSGAVYNFQGSGFQISFDGTCATVDPSYYTPFTLTNAGVDVRSAAAGALVLSGVEEDCEVFASWQGTIATLPLAGVYSLSVTVTMTSI